MVPIVMSKSITTWWHQQGQLTSGCRGCMASEQGGRHKLGLAPHAYPTLALPQEDSFFQEAPLV